MAAHARWFTILWNRRLSLVVESLAIAALLLVNYLALSGRVGMHVDENHFIATSNVWEPFVHGDRSSAVWSESYVTLTAMPATRYLVGMGRALGGYGPDELIRLWTFGASAEHNAATGAMPSHALLWWSRIPMVVLAVLAVLASYWLLRSMFGAAVAYLGLAMLALSHWVGENLVRAMSEAPLICSLLLVVAAATRLVVVARTFSVHQQLFWLVIAGLGVGFAGSLKLNGLTAAVGVMVVWIAVVGLAHCRKPVLARLSLAVCGGALFLVVVGATLVAFNPYLDADPPRRLLQLVGYRTFEMRNALTYHPSWPLKGIGDRLQFIYTIVFVQAAPLRYSAAGAAYVVFWLVGCGVVGRRTWDGLRQRVLDPAGAAFLVALAAAGPMLATPLRWDRYLFLPVWFSALLIAVGATLCLRAIIGAIARGRGWRAGVQLDTTPGEPRAGSS